MFSLKKFKPQNAKSYDTIYSIDQLSSLFRGEDGAPIDFMAQYSKSLYVFAVINKIATKTADIDWKLAKIINAKGETEEMLLHPVLDLLAKFNPFQTKSEFLKTTIINKKLTGEAFWLKVKDGKGQVTELWNLRPDLITVVGDPNKFIKHYEFHTGKAERQIFLPEDIIHFREPDPLNPLRGMSALRPSSSRVETEQAATDYQRNFFKNNARPDALLMTDESLDTDQRDQMTTAWEERHEGPSSAGKLGFLEGGMKYQQVSISQREMDFIESMKFTREDILIAFGVPKSVITTDGVNFANAEAGMKMFMSEVVAPEMDQLEETINEFMIMPDFGEELYVHHTDPVPPDASAMREEHAAGYGKWLTLNEIREQLGLQPIEGGDVISEEGGAPVDDNQTTAAKSIKLLPSEKLRAKIVKKLHGRKTLQVKFALKEDIRGELFKQLSKKKNHKKNDIISTSLFPDDDSRLAYYNLVNKRIDKRALTFKEALLDGAKAQENRIIKALSKLDTIGKTKDSIEDILQSLIDYNSEVRIFGTLALPFLESFADDAGKEAADLFDEEFNFTTRLSKSIVKRSRFFATSVTNTTFQRLNNQLTIGVSNGEGIGALTARVQSIYTEYPTWRANLIARTEATAANNEGFVEQYKQSKVVKGKEWVATLDDRTRDAHTDLNGEVVAVDQPFSNGLAYPQEPNCRCVISPSLVGPKTKVKFKDIGFVDYEHECEHDKANGHGGRREGAGRPRGSGNAEGGAARGKTVSVTSTHQTTDEDIMRDSYPVTLEDGTVVRVARGVYLRPLEEGASSELMEGRILMGPEEMVGKGAWEVPEVYTTIVSEHQALQNGVTGGDFSVAQYTEQQDLVSHQLYMYKRSITTDVNDTSLNTMTQAYLDKSSVIGAHKVAPVDKMKSDVGHYAKEQPNSEFAASELAEFPRREVSMRLRDIDQARDNSVLFGQASVDQFSSEVTRTQDNLRATYGENITLYRGVSGDYANEIRTGLVSNDKISIGMNNASSWTSDESVARQFSAGSGVVIRQEIPVSTILFSHVTSPYIKPVQGFGGTLNESEFIVGTVGNSRVINNSDII